MKIALIGYGKMGKLIEQHALNRNHEIVAIIAPTHSTALQSPKQLVGVDLCIDFSHPDAVLENIQIAIAANCSIVIGTTGWYHLLPEVYRLIAASNIGLLYAPNFSIGISLFLHIVTQAAALIAPFNSYDVAGIELHHNEKVDAPSGTAKTLATKIAAACPRKKDIDFASVRVGSTPGTHTVIFDSPADTITLTHTARNREGFAAGAIRAAEWLLGKKGVFTIDDFLTDSRGFCKTPDQVDF